MSPDGSLVNILSNEYKNDSGIIKYDGIFYEIPNEYFYLSNITSITLPDHVTELGYGAFAQCSFIESIVLPKNVITIGSYAFSSCDSLKSITIPKSMKFIYEGAFRDCSNLNSIIFKGTIEEWNIIDKGPEWNYDVPATYVQCTDGQVEL